MKFLSLTFLIFVSCKVFASWTSGTVNVRTDNSKAPQAVFVSAQISNQPNYGPAPGQWFRVNTVTDLGMPSGVKSVFLNGILIITHGSTNQTCSINFSARAPGDTLDPLNYICQTVEAHIGGGQRSTCSTWAPVVNDEIELYWQRTTFGSWPTECSYGINLVAQAFINQG